MTSPPLKPDDLCPRPEFPAAPSTDPLAPPIYPAAVYRCNDPAEADALLAGSLDGYVYARDGHPNGQMLAEKCRLLHGADEAVVCSSGMAAISVAVLSQLAAGDHLVVSRDLYGRTFQLMTSELARLGVEVSVVDGTDAAAVGGACRPATRLVVVETISNPLLRVADLGRLAQVAHDHQALLFVDNTFAGPTVCRPLEHGADLVMESLTKIINGHSDVMLGLLCGPSKHWDRVSTVHSAWGFSPSPFDCWLAVRGLGTLALRAERANANARQVAAFLVEQPAVERVHFPGLPSHPDHQIAASQFGGQFGTIVTFGLRGGRPAAEQFIAAANQIPFCPSLGDLSTTLSHPTSTSHRGLSPAERQDLGITGGLIRLSVGIESPESICRALTTGLVAAAE